MGVILRTGDLPNKSTHFSPVSSLLTSSFTYAGEYR